MMQCSADALLFYHMQDVLPRTSEGVFSFYGKCRRSVLRERRHFAAVVFLYALRTGMPAVFLRLLSAAVAGTIFADIFRRADDLDILINSEFVDDVLKEGEVDHRRPDRGAGLGIGGNEVLIMHFRVVGQISQYDI
jgi:hypothetical protein